MFDNRNRGPNDSTMWRWGALGTITCISIYAATIVNSDSSFIVNLFGSFMTVLGAGIAFGIFSLIGGIIDRLVLGNDGEDTASKLRYGISFAVLVILVFIIVQFF